MANNKPKMTGLSFNLFAIAGILIILPLATAFVTNLSNSNEGDYENVNEAWRADTGRLVYEDCPTLQTAYMTQWIDKGSNSTGYYLSQMPGQTENGLSSIWDTTDFFYNEMMLLCRNANQTFGPGTIDNNGNPVYGFPADNTQINGKTFMNGFDIHGWAKGESELDGYTWPGYVQDIGNSFSFRVTENYFQYLDSSQEISSLKLTFVDDEYIFNCDSPIFQTLGYKSDIEFFIDGNSIGSYDNFDFDKKNRYKVRYQSIQQYWGNGTPMPSGSNVCMLGFILEYNFTPIESIILNEEIRQRYSNLSAVIEVYDLDYNVITDPSVYGNTSNGDTAQYKPPIPILDDEGHLTLFEVAYVDGTKVNFWLNGGTLVMGIALFLLAIANTPYWNPVIDFFKPKGA